MVGLQAGQCSVWRETLGKMPGGEAIVRVHANWITDSAGLVRHPVGPIDGVLVRVLGLHIDIGGSGAGTYDVYLRDEMGADCLFPQSTGLSFTFGTPGQSLAEHLLYNGSAPANPPRRNIAVCGEQAIEIDCGVQTYGEVQIDYIEGWGLRYPSASRAGTGAMSLHRVLWLSDSSGAAEISLDGIVHGRIFGILDRVVTRPGAAAPTDNYDVTLVDRWGVDLLGGVCVNRDTANVETALVWNASAPQTWLEAVAPGSPLRLLVQNAGSGKAGEIGLYVMG